MAGIPFARLFAPTLLVMLSACIPGATRPAPTSPPPPSRQPARPPVRQPVATPPVVQRTPLPPSTPAAAPPAAPVQVQTPTWIASPVTPDAISVPMGKYLVGRGDTLSSIAAKTGASKEDIARENAILPPYTVKLGQNFRIAGGRYHVVLELSGRMTFE